MAKKDSRDVNISDFSLNKWKRAIELRKKGKYQEAEEELKGALDEDPGNFLLKSSLAETYLRQDRLTEARIMAEAILSLDPQYPQARYILGEVFFKENRFEQALQCFHHASQKDQRPYLILRVAKTLRKMERYGEALETLDSVLISERQNLSFLKEKALVLGRMEHWDQALTIYEKLYELDPEDSFVRKEIYRLKGKKWPDEKVINELKAVVNLPSRKDDPQLHGLLGQKLKEAGKLKEAAAEFRTALHLDPNNVFYLKLEGFCYYRLKDYEKAIQTLGDAFRRRPGDYIVKTTLEKIYRITKDLKGFMSLLEEIIEEQPRNVKLIGTLNRIKKQVHANETGDN